MTFWIFYPVANFMQYPLFPPYHSMIYIICQVSKKNFTFCMKIILEEDTYSPSSRIWSKARICQQILKWIIFVHSCMYKCMFWDANFFLLHMFRRDYFITWQSGMKNRTVCSSLRAVLTLRFVSHLKLVVFTNSIRGKSLLELGDTTFLSDWQPPLIFISFTSKSHEH